MSFSILTFLVSLAVLGASGLPHGQTFSHEGVGYSLLNHTVKPVLSGCTITSASQVKSVTASCTNINVGGFTVDANQQPLVFNLKQGTTITFTGEIRFSKHNFNGYLIEIMGNNIKASGSSSHKFNGMGTLYYDGKGYAGSTKPTFMYLKGTNSVFRGFSIKNCPVRCVAIDGSNNIEVSGFLIDNRDGAPGKAPKGKEGHNTDGFDVSKTQYLTLKNNVVYNQDDCVAINDGAHLLIDNLNCDGSHGFDIATGMSKTDRNLNVVNNVTFQNSKLTNGMYGLHILTCNDGGKGQVSNIYYKNINFNGPSDYGIMIQQDFSNSGQGSTGKPTANVPISNVQFHNVQGKMNGKYSYALSIRCAKGACSGISFDKVSISNAKSKNECMNYKLSGWC